MAKMSRFSWDTLYVQRRGHHLEQHLFQIFFLPEIGDFLPMYEAMGWKYVRALRIRMSRAFLARKLKISLLYLTFASSRVENKNDFAR